MSPPSEPRRPSPRLRARAKVVAPEGLRPEVADALEGLERSIGEVADWEHQLAAAGSAVDAGGAPADVVLVARVQPQAEDRVELPPPPPPVEPVRRPARRTRALEATPPPPVPPPLDLGDLHLDVPERPAPVGDDPTLDVSAIGAPAPVAGELPTSDLDLSGLAAGAAADPMATWVEHTASPNRFGPDPDQVRRRRNGRILSWLGAIILVVVAAWLLIPDHSPSRPHLVNEGKTTTTTEATTSSTAQLGSQFSVPTLPPTSVTTPVVTTPPTTARHGTTATTRPPTTTTTAHVTPVTTPPPTTTPTIVTPPTSTTTTCPIGDVPEPGGGC